MKISELRSPYRELAELRTTNEGKFDLFTAFTWEDTPEGAEFWVDVNALSYPTIPAESLKELQPEWVVGEDYEFSDNDTWCKGKLLAIVDNEHHYIASINGGSGYPTAWKEIRHIQPQVTELTLEEIAEKFGVSVESIKIKK